jgi:hypothetical protein
MKLPRMTIRRWMVAAAAIALAFGGHRLKQRRGACLMRATRHAEAEAYHRRLSVRPPIRTDLRVEPDLEATTSPAPSAELERAIEQEFGLRPERANRSEGGDRFREAQARHYALADKLRKLVDDYRGKQSKYHAKQADYHASLARKYDHGARYPWLTIEPDPPEPTLDEPALESRNPPK